MPVMSYDLIDPDAVKVARIARRFLEENVQNVHWEVWADAWVVTVYIYNEVKDRKFTVVDTIAPKFFLGLGDADRQLFLIALVKKMTSTLGRGMFIKGDAVEPPGLGGTERAMVTDRWR